MSKIKVINSKFDIGIKFRTPTPGPEFDMVNQFVEKKIESFRHKEHNLAIFIEPMVNNSYPDIVIAEYSPRILENWNETRSLLSQNDIKILQNLRAMKGGNASKIITRTNFSYKDIIESLEKLYDSNLIVRKNKLWKPVALRDSFYIKRLTSIEAKIGQWDKLHSQADMNKWFASESYALSKTKKPQTKTVEKFKSSGIGLYTLNSGDLIKLNNAQKQGLPTNYMSWMFNEWVGRSLT